MSTILRQVESEGSDARQIREHLALMADETRDHARARRLAEFARSIHGEPREKDDTGSLADKFLLSTYELPRALHRTAGGRARDYDPVMLRYRMAIRRAKRFALTREFVEAVTEVSSSTMPDKMLSRLPLAVLPFATTWIEFDLRTKVRTTQRLAAESKAAVAGVGSGLVGRDPDNVEGVAERAGVLLQRDAEKPSKFRMTLTGPLSTDTASDRRLTPVLGLESPYLLAYDVDTASDANVVSGKLLDNDTALDTERMRALPWGYAHLAPDGFANLNLAPGDLLRHAAPCYSDLFWTLAGVVPRENVRHLASIVMDEAVLGTGMVRWVVTLLAMLSDVPLYHSERVEPAGGQHAGAQPKPRLDFHRLSVKLPKVHAARYIGRRLDRATTKHRAHEVRAHWRTYLAEFPCTRDAHRWEYSGDMTHRMCLACASRGSLVREHVRGDESLGWVRKEYTLDHNRRAR